MIRTSHRGPLYRQIVTQAFQAAWHDRRYWILSALAGILVTAGSYDVLWNAVMNITKQGQFVAVTTGMAFIETVAATSASGLHRVISVIGGIEILLFLALLIVFVAAISCIAQGALVFALGARVRGRSPTLKEAFKVGSHALWPVVVLNIMALAAIWILRFLVSLPLFLALEFTTTTAYLTYLLSFIVFVPLVLLVAILQIFALNAVILQGAHLSEALRRGYMMIKDHWLVVLETAALQIALSFTVWFVFAVTLLVSFLPLFFLIFTSAVASSESMLAFGLIVGSMVFIVGLVLAAAFTVQLQYATWTYLYRRLGEGGAIPKLHRIFRGLFGFFRIPQA